MSRSRLIQTRCNILSRIRNGNHFTRKKPPNSSSRVHQPRRVRLLIRVIGTNKRTTNFPTQLLRYFSLTSHLTRRLVRLSQAAHLKPITNRQGSRLLNFICRLVDNLTVQIRDLLLGNITSTCSVARTHALTSGTNVNKGINSEKNILGRFERMPQATHIIRVALDNRRILRNRRVGNTTVIYRLASNFRSRPIVITMGIVFPCRV